MILFQNSIVTLNYDPATDVLQAQYPDLHGFLLPEIKHTILLMTDIIRNYDVKKLLLDSTRTVIAVSSEESREIAAFLAGNIMTTRVEKVARVQSDNQQVEEHARQNMAHVQEVQVLPFQLRNFSSHTEAIAWLTNTATPQS